MKPKFPSISALRCALVREQRYLRRSFTRAELVERGEDFAGTDCRLRILPNGGGWQLLTGSSDYDQDHRGYGGASCLSYDRANLTDLARELINDARESYAMSQDAEGEQ